MNKHSKYLGKSGFNLKFGAQLREEKDRVIGGGDLTRQQHQDLPITGAKQFGKAESAYSPATRREEWNPRLCSIIASPLSPSLSLCLSLLRLEILNPNIRCWLSTSPSVPRLSSYQFSSGHRYTRMCESELDLDNGSASELTSQCTDGWSTNLGDEDDSDGSEEPQTREGDSGPANSEYQGYDGGGGDVDALIEDHGNSENIMGEQFNNSDPVNDEEENIVRKFFYCNRQGLCEKKYYERVDRKRPHNPETRTNCNANLITKTLVEEHNHDLASPAFTNIMASHRKITEGHKVHIHSMHEAIFLSKTVIHART
ncbi:hypothetical protein Ahy_A08g038616 [Arachis hypogaea]|uniref:FAR1 domain-containing protein n=1 Tax=Arachis hypogaea TaxID=3818 RepID=A0A445BTX6_ARAHY|nr:hypothetical protein Ahy_A08g038616 [Arachis hypogaea]